MASSSSDESDSSDGPGPAKRRHLALPGCIAGLYAAGPRGLGGGTAHQGRARRVPHVEGNFPCFVYLAVRATPEWCRSADVCAKALRALASRCPDNECSGAGGAGEVHLVDTAEPGWHVSLGPTVYLRHQFIKPLLERLEAVVARMLGPGGALPPVFFEEPVEVFVAPEGDRFFGGLVAAEASRGTLRQLAAAVREVMQGLGLVDVAAAGAMPIEAMRFHCSLVWSLASIRPALAAQGVERLESPWGESWRLAPTGPVCTVQEGAPWQGPALAEPAVHVRVGQRTSIFGRAAAGEASSQESE